MTYPSEPDYSIEGLCIRYLTESELEVSMEEKQNWKICDGTTFNLATTLVYQDQHWQIYDQSMYEHGWVYYCKKWPEATKTWETIFLEPGKWEEVQYGNAETKLYERRTEFHNFFYEFALGFIPGRWQTWLSDNWAQFSTERATNLNAVLNLFFAGFFYLNVPPLGAFIAVFLLLDSVIRRALLFSDTEAVGFLPLEVLDWVLYMVYSPFLPEDF